MLRRLPLRARCKCLAQCGQRGRSLLAAPARGLQLAHGVTLGGAGQVRKDGIQIPVWLAGRVAQGLRDHRQISLLQGLRQLWRSRGTGRWWLRMPRGTFAIASGIVIVTALVARLLAQKGLSQ